MITGSFERWADRSNGGMCGELDGGMGGWGCVEGWMEGWMNG